MRPSGNIGTVPGIAGSRSLSTASLAPRPHENVYASPQRTYPDGSTYGRPYTVAPQRNAHAPRQYVDPGTPTPRHMADAGYRPSSGIQTAESIAVAGCTGSSTCAVAD